MAPQHGAQRQTDTGSAVSCQPTARLETDWLLCCKCIRLVAPSCDVVTLMAAQATHIAAQCNNYNTTHNNYNTTRHAGPATFRSATTKCYSVIGNDSVPIHLAQCRSAPSAGHFQCSNINKPTFSKQNIYGSIFSKQHSETVMV